MNSSRYLSLNAADLAAVVEAPETSVSHALRLLRASGVVRNRKSGRLVYYALDDDHVRLLLDVSAEHLRHDPRRDQRRRGLSR